MTIQRSSSTHPVQAEAPRLPRRRAAVHRGIGIALVLSVATGASSACLPGPVPWTPTEEDTGPDSGPDPGTCEFRRDCPPVVK